MKKGRIYDDKDRCVICNKDMPAKIIRMIEVSISGDLIREDDPRSNGPESQGCFPIGPECWRVVRVSGKVWGS